MNDAENHFLTAQEVAARLALPEQAHYRTGQRLRFYVREVKAALKASQEGYNLERVN